MNHAMMLIIVIAGLFVLRLYCIVLVYVHFNPLRLTWPPTVYSLTPTTLLFEGEEAAMELNMVVTL